MAVTQDTVVVGKKYRFNNKHAGGIDWFINGSIITITKLDGTGSPRAEGPAKEFGVGGKSCEKGDIIQGYAPLRCLEELEVEGVKFEAATRTIETTVITVDRKLTAAEQAAIEAIVEKGNK